MATSLTSLQRELVEEFGNIYESHGLKRLKGLIVGLLLTQEEPASLDDMTELLGRSKGPISQAIRALADIGLVRKVSGPINRRDYYIAHPDLFFNNFKFNMATVRRNRQLAHTMLEKAEASGQANPAMIANLEHMQAFYALMEDFYQDFSKHWKKLRLQRMREQAPPEAA